MQNIKMSRIDWISLLLLSLLWGGSFFFIEILLKYYPPLTIVFMRVFLGALLLLVINIFTGQSLPRGKKVWLSFLLMGILNNVIPQTLIVWGQKSITGGLASIFNATTPFFTILAAQFLTTDEKITPLKIMGVLVGLAGVILLFGIGERGDGRILGPLAILTASFSYALAGIWGRQFKKMGVPPSVTAAGQLICASLILSPLSLILDKPWSLPLPGADGMAALLGLALLSTSLAYILYFRILSSAGATNVLLVTFLIPVSAMILGGLFLGEIITSGQLVGMVVIGMGLLLIDGRVIKQRKVV